MRLDGVFFFLIASLSITLCRLNVTNSSKRSPDEKVLFFEVERMLGLKPVVFGDAVDPTEQFLTPPTQRLWL